MAHFYGNLSGARGEATRCGTAASGISASVRSYGGSITVSLSDHDGVTAVEIRVASDSATGGALLWYGPLAALIAAQSLRTIAPSKPAAA